MCRAIHACSSFGYKSPLQEIYINYIKFGYFPIIFLFNPDTNYSGLNRDTQVRMAQKESEVLFIVDKFKYSADFFILRILLENILGQTHSFNKHILMYVHLRLG